jgi:hypothetical protein
LKYLLQIVDANKTVLEELPPSQLGNANVDPEPDDLNGLGGSGS